MKERKDILSKRRQLLAASALVPVVGALSRPTALQGMIYTFFVCVYLVPIVIKAAGKKENANGSDRSDQSGKPGGSGVANKPAGEAADKPEAVPSTEQPSGTSLAESAAAQITALKQRHRIANLNFVLALIGAGLISECLAWVSELFAPAPNPALMHPQLVADLYLAFFYYLGVAAAWLLLSKRYEYALKDVFFISFLVALVNQAKIGTLAALCERIVSDPIAAVLAIASLLVVGGSVTSLAFLAGGKVAHSEKKAPLLKLVTKYAVSFVLAALLPYLTCLGGGLAGKPLGLCPDKKPIWDAPLI